MLRQVGVELLEHDEQLSLSGLHQMCCSRSNSSGDNANHLPLPDHEAGLLSDGEEKLEDRCHDGSLCHDHRADAVSWKHWHIVIVAHH